MVTKDMKRIRKIILLLLPGVMFATLSVVIAGDAAAQRRPGRSGLVQLRIIKKLPQGYETFRIDDREFFHYGGTFYRKVRDNFVVIRAPRGAQIERLPAGYTTVSVSERAYYRYKNVFFRESDGGYEVVAPPIGKKVDQLPQGYETLATRGDIDLYFHEGLLYKADPSGDSFTIINPRHRARSGRNSARFSRPDRRGGSQYDRFRTPSRLRRFESGRRRNVTPGWMRRSRRF